MKKKIQSIIISGLCALTGQAQTNPAITSWVINANNGTGYNCSGCSPAVHGTIPTDIASVYYTATDAYITASGVPSYDIGPWKQNPNVPANQNKIWKITLNPTKNTGTLTQTPLGNLGIWSNGVGVYNPKDGYAWNTSTNAFATSPTATALVRNAYVYEAVSFDACLGHADAKGSYHNHVNPKCLYDATASTLHSPIIGFALDGFPIYGAYGYTNTNGTGAIKRMTSSYVLSVTRTNPTLTQVAAGGLCDDYVYTAGSGDLDEHNGRLCITPEYPNGIYAYFVTIDASGTPVYPFVLGPTYYGIVPAGVTSGTATIPSGATKYSPTVAVIDEIENSNSIVSIHPNPAVDNIIKFDIANNTKDLNVSVIDYQGRTLVYKSFTRNSYGNQLSIDTPYLKSGNYWIRFEYDGKKEVRKVLVDAD